MGGDAANLRHRSFPMLRVTTISSDSWISTSAIDQRMDVTASSANRYGRYCDSESSIGGGVAFAFNVVTVIDILKQNDCTLPQLRAVKAGSPPVIFFASHSYAIFISCKVS